MRKKKIDLDFPLWTTSTFPTQQPRNRCDQKKIETEFSQGTFHNSHPNKNSKMTFTPIDELPPPPAWMLEDAEKSDLAEAHSLLPQLWTIREFRKIALPIVLGVKSKTGPIMRDAIKSAKDATIAYWMSRFPREEVLLRRVADETFRRSINRTPLCERKREAAKAFQEKQLGKFVAFNNGRVPKNRLNAARNMSDYWKKTWREDEDYSGHLDEKCVRPMSFLDAHNIPRDRAGLKFCWDNTHIYGKVFVKYRFHTHWEMMDYWKKNWKFVEPGFKVTLSEFEDALFKINCVIY